MIAAESGRTPRGAFGRCSCRRWHSRGATLEFEGTAGRAGRGRSGLVTSSEQSVRVVTGFTVTVYTLNSQPQSGFVCV